MIDTKAAGKATETISILINQLAKDLKAEFRVKGSLNTIKIHLSNSIFLFQIA